MIRKSKLKSIVLRPPKNDPKSAALQLQIVAVESHRSIAAISFFIQRLSSSPPFRSFSGLLLAQINFD